MSAEPILITGGAGFIGSHTAKLLGRSGLQPAVYDNLSTGNRSAVRWGPFIHADLLQTAQLVQAIERYKPRAVIHFAASVSVGESVGNPAKYYLNNVAGTQSLLDACLAGGVDKIIFSSSSAIYGMPAELPITEAAQQQPINPYGRTKLIAEDMLRDYAAAHGLRYVILRYSNACGADPDGELGEWHTPETHLIPRALMAAVGIIPYLEVFGDDYETDDGTCVRDYIHVSDLAQAHLLAYQHLAAGGRDLTVNLGTGRGTSVREILGAIRRVLDREVPVRTYPRRAGDPPALYADPRLARSVLGFAPKYSDLETVIRTAAPFFAAGVRL